MAEFNSGAGAVMDLFANGTFSKTLVSGGGTVGKQQNRINLSAVDAFYAFTMTSVSPGDTFTLNLGTSTCTSNETGTVTDGDGNDFTGDDFPAVNTLYALMLIQSATDNDTITVAADAPGIFDGEIGQLTSFEQEQIIKTGLEFGAQPNILFTFAGAGDSLTVIVAAKQT